MTPRENHADSTQTTAEWPASVEISPALQEYADRLLLSTGLTGRGALEIASGRQGAPEHLQGVARALRAGWTTEPSEASARS